MPDWRAGAPPRNYAVTDSRVVSLWSVTKPNAPYDRPPLSKQVLSGKWPLAHTLLATPEKLADAGVELRLGVGARSLDVASTGVTLSDDGVVEGTHVVIATGARARRLPWYEPNNFELRSRVDAQRLITRLEELSPGDVVAIVGAGFIGAEVATAVKTRGLHPVVLEAEDRPLLHVLGETVSQWLRGLPELAGVELRTNQKVSGATYRYDNGDADVEFMDGSTLRARAVIAGVGALAQCRVAHRLRPDTRQRCGHGLQSTLRRARGGGGRRGELSVVAGYPRAHRALAGGDRPRAERSRATGRRENRRQW